MDRGFDLFVRMAGPAMSDSLCLRRGKTLGHGLIPISRRLDRFKTVLKWDYGILGGLTPVTSWCCILCYDHANS